MSLSGLLAEGVRTGELPADLDTELMAEALAGPIILRRLMSAEPARSDEGSPPRRPGARPTGDGSNEAAKGRPAAGRVASQPTMTAALRFDHVSMVFPDGTHARRRRHARACEPTEFVTIVGPSGCGKSTLLRIAAGLEAEHGRLGRPSPQTDLGYVFQDATLLPWRTVARNVELLAELHGMPARERARRRGGTRSSSSDSAGFERSTREQLSGRHAGCGPRWPDRSSCARRCSCSTSRSARWTRSPGNGSTTSCCALFQHEGFAALFITHSITEAVYLSTRVAVMSPRPGRIRRRVRRAVPVPPHPRPALRARVRHAGRRGLPRPTPGARLIGAWPAPRGAQPIHWPPLTSIVAPVM